MPVSFNAYLEHLNTPSFIWRVNPPSPGRAMFIDRDGY